MDGTASLASRRAFLTSLGNPWGDAKDLSRLRSQCVTAPAALARLLGPPSAKTLKELAADAKRARAAQEAKSSVPDSAVGDDESTTESAEGSSGENNGGGDDGSKEDGGGDDDGEPPLDWWQWSLIIAAVVTIAELVVLLTVWKLNRYYLPALISTFLAAFGISLMCNPKLWFRRMSEGSFAALCGGQLLGGLSFSIPVPWAPDSFELSIPAPDSTTTLVLGMLTLAFGLMHLVRTRPGGR